MNNSKINKNEYGKFTKLIDLEVGTMFWVRNGCWEGSIVEVDGVKSIYVYDTDKTHTIKDTDELAIDIYKKKRVK